MVDDFHEMESSTSAVLALAIAVGVPMLLLVRAFRRPNADDDGLTEEKACAQSRESCRHETVSAATHGPRYGAMLSISD